MDVERWKSAANLSKEHPPSGIWMEHDGLATTSNIDWYSFYKYYSYENLPVPFLFICGETVYGGLHALSWNAHSRTRPEQVLWWVSMSIILGFGPLAAIFVGAIVFFNDIDVGMKRNKEDPDVRTGTYPALLLLVDTCSSACRSAASFLSRRLKWIRQGTGPIFRLAVAAGALAAADICLTSLFARVFLVVKGFVVIFHSEPGVFSNLVWLFNMPYIS